jgi:hypothetical protein
MLQWGDLELGQDSEFCVGAYEDRTLAGDRGLASVAAITRKHLVTD